MERLDGLNLKALMARKKLATAEVLDISVQVADALEAAHAKGVIHCDIKPGNIVISPLGAVKVLAQHRPEGPSPLCRAARGEIGRASCRERVYSGV